MDPRGGIMPRQIIRWLDERVSFPVVRGVPGQPLPDMPNVLGVLTVTGGPGLTLEGAYDRVSFQLRCRGDQNKPDQADDMGREVDAVLLTADMPTIDGIPTLGFSRTGGGPSPMPTDTGESPTTVCTYIVQAASVL